LLALAFYAAATLLIAWPLPLHVGETVARAVRPDTWLNLWALAWTSEHLLGDPAALFHANIFFPHANTLAYSDHFIGEALLAAPLYRVTGSATLAYNLAWYAALVLTAWGGYLWLRELLADQPGGEAAALVGGAVCLFVPGKRTTLSHLQVISLQGVTLSLLALHALLRRPRLRSAAALAAAALYAALCSWYTAAYIALLLPMVGLAGLWLGGGAAADAGAAWRSHADAPSEGKRIGDGAADGPPARAAEAKRARVAAWGAAALLSVVVVMVPVAMPYRAVQAELQITRPVEELVATSLRPIDFAASWSWLHEGWMPAGSGAGGYFPGFLALGLGAFGLWIAGRRREPWSLVYGALAAVFLVLSLGPYLEVGGWRVPLPYAGLYALVPGFGALRNPYRAAFIATLLFALPVARGAAALIAACRARLRWEERRNGRPFLEPLAWGLAVALAGVHLLEAWPGPQQVAPLPRPPSGAYAWLAADAPPEPTAPAAEAAEVPPRPGESATATGLARPARSATGTASPAEAMPRPATLVWPLPRPLDDNARYQLWTIGSWTPLINGHSGVYPADFVALYEVGAEFPDARFLAALKEAYPVERVLAHYGLADEGAAVRARAPAAGLEEVWAEADDVIYRIGNGAESGWLRRRLPVSRLGDTIRVELPVAAAGCRVGVALDGRAVGQAPASETAELPLPEPSGQSPFAVLEIWLVDAGGQPALELAAARTPAPEARLHVNGWPLVAAPFVAARIEGATGRLAGWRTGGADDSAAASLLALLAAGSPGDTLAVAIAEQGDATLIERLRLLLDVAGGPARTDAAPDIGGAYAFVGEIGAPPGSAREAAGVEAAVLSAAAGEGGAADCRLAPINGFEWRRAAGR
jgi:hypothetical protein